MADIERTIYRHSASTTNFLKSLYYWSLKCLISNHIQVRYTKALDTASHFILILKHQEGKFCSTATIFGFGSSLPVLKVKYLSSGKVCVTATPGANVM